MMKSILREIVTSPRTGFSEITIGRAMLVLVFCVTMALLFAACAILSFKPPPQIHTDLVKLNAMEDASLFYRTCSSFTDITNYGHKGLVIGQFPGVGEIFLRRRYHPTSLIQELKSVTCQLRIPHDGALVATSYYGIRSASNNGRAVCLPPNSTQESARVYAMHDIHDLSALVDATNFLANTALVSLPKVGPDTVSITGVLAKVGEQSRWVTVNVTVQEMETLIGYTDAFELSCEQDWQQHIPRICHHVSAGKLCCINGWQCYSKVLTDANNMRAIRLTKTLVLGMCGTNCSNFTLVRSAVQRRLVGLPDLWFIAQSLCPQHKTDLGPYWTNLSDATELFAGYAVSPMFTYECQRNRSMDFLTQVSRIWPMLSMVYSTLFGFMAKNMYSALTHFVAVGGRTADVHPCAELA